MKTLIIASLLVILQITVAAQNYWEQTNGPFTTGYVTAINADSNGNVFAALDKAGLYRSTDNGQSFSYVSNTLAGKSIRSILVNQLGHIFTPVFPDTGVFRSTDDGMTWIQKLPSEYVRIMTLDSDGNIYAGTNGSGIFRSTDDGDTWIHTDVDTIMRVINALASSPTGYVYAAGWRIFRTTDAALIRSSDNGLTWDLLTIPQDLFVTNFAFSLNGNLVASFQPKPPADSSGFLLSTDSGITWVRKNFGGGAFYLDHLPLLFDKPSNSFYAVEPYWDFFKSIDYGNTWSLVSHINYDQPDIICFTSNQKDRLFFGNINGLKYSSNSGYNWVQSDNGFYATALRNLTLLPNDRLFVGNIFGTFKLADDKTNWLNVNAKVGSFLISNTGDYFLSNGNIYKSTDGGNSWVLVFDSNSFTATFEITKSSNGYIFASGYWYGGVHGTGSGMVWRSTDNGENWDVVFGNGGDRLLLTIKSIHNDIILTGGNDGQIVRSTDLGETWNLSNAGLPTDAYCVVIREGHNGSIFAGTINYGVYRSTDSGLSWNSVNNGLNSSDVRTITINSQGKIFAGTSNGVYESINDGENWSARNSGLIDVSILSLLCDSLDYLYAATNSTGVYRSLLSTTSVDINNNFVFNYKLSQNYPNPFNPTTIIRYTIPPQQNSLLGGDYRGGLVTLRVYDVLGNEIATLVNEEKPAGNYEVEFDGANLTSGVYFYRLQAGDYAEAKKMVLLK